ncbi:hypothetical protein EQG41_20820 [Billgrantia azerbaijanica]|nr:hypothetical protein EQG41_20820 [Halomonas azerbaijanica]
MDEGVRSGSEAPSVDEIADVHFRAFVRTVTGHISSWLTGACVDRERCSEASRLHFVRLPLASSGDEPIGAVPALEAWPSDTCRVSSPWIDLAIQRTPSPQVRGVVRWNERQLLLDQAVIAGLRNPLDTPPEPLTGSEFERLAQEYADAEILRQPLAQPVEERIPPDLLWLFRHSWQSTRGPFAGMARGAMRAAVERGAEGYTQLVVALIDHCLASEGGRHQYTSVRDVANLFSVEQYRIDQLAR